MGWLGWGRRGGGGGFVGLGFDISGVMVFLQWRCFAAFFGKYVGRISYPFDRNITSATDLSRLQLSC